MTTFWENELTIFFADFGINAVYGAATIKVLFHNAYEAATLFGQEIASANPFIEVKTADLEEIQVGELLTIDGVEYKVKDPPRPDGTGISIINLTKEGL